MLIDAAAPEVADEVLAGQKTLSQAKRKLQPQKKATAPAKTRSQGTSSNRTDHAAGDKNTLIIQSDMDVGQLAERLLQLMGKDKASQLCEALKEALSKGKKTMAKKLPQSKEKPHPRRRRKVEEDPTTFG
jgi:hypothetical protein